MDPEMLKGNVCTRSVLKIEGSFSYIHNSSRGVLFSIFIMTNRFFYNRCQPILLKKQTVIL
jgi:hypothetical protein